MIEQIPWDGRPRIGWWRHQKELILYHGTHVRNLDSVLKNGLNRKDPSTGFISMALEPNTAIAYASMSGVGGEANFRKQGGKPQNTKMADRVCFCFELSMEWILDHYDEYLSGNTKIERLRMLDINEYHPGNDNSYYQRCELRFKTAIPSHSCIGYMTKDNSTIENND